MADDGWFVVKGRKSCKKRYAMNLNTSDDAEVVDRDALVSMMNRSLEKVKRSAFYETLRTQLQDSATFSFLEVDSLDVVIYGLGKISQSEVSRCQLALMLLLREDLVVSVSKIYVYDPVLSASEKEFLLELGCSMIDVNEQGLRKVCSPTLFYMPHCEPELYDNVLRANWESLRHVGILGNSFKCYMERWSAPPLPSSTRPRHVLTIQPHADEHAVDAMDFPACSAFNDMSWHFFHDDLTPQVFHEV